MKKRDRKALSEYIRRVADLMELRDWTVSLSKEPSPEGISARVSVTYGRKLAWIQVAPAFRDEHPDDQRQTIVHELVHCHVDAAYSMVLNDLEELLGKPADSIFLKGYKRQMEHGVDALASALAKRMPLVDWPG